MISEPPFPNQNRKPMLRTSFLLLFAALAVSCGDGDSTNEDSLVNDTVDVVSTPRVTPTQPTAPTGAAGATGTENGNVSPRSADEKMRLVVSFISQGEGIDRKTHDAFVTWVKQKGNIRYDAQNWGREGETNYCFALDNLSPNEQDEFVEEVRAQLVGRTMVHIDENASCSNWK
jgi:hypothetical protein